MDLSFCNGQKRYDFNEIVGYHINDLSPQAFRRGYVAALFVEDERWLTAIEKYQMVVPGSPLNSRDKARDATTKQHIQEQVSSSTYEDRKRFFKAWRQAPSCSDDCDRYCDQCSNGGIKFKPVSTYGLDSDVRRFITKYGRYQTASELEKEEKSGKERSSTTVLSGVRDRKSNDDAIRLPGQERDRLFGEPEEVSSDQAERIEALLLHTISEEMVT